MIEELPVVVPPRPGAEAFDHDNREHPMRLVTEAVVDEPTSWTPERVSAVAAVFDGLAAGWNERIAGEGHLDAVQDALDRGSLGGGVAIEVGSGTGAASPTLATRFDRLTSFDLSMEMLRRAPAAAPRVQADGSRLPLPDRSVDVVVLINVFLFADEVSRVLGPDGAVMWVNTLGTRTPIHLPAERVAAALPGGWDGVQSQAGVGTWCVLRRRAR